ncbi:tetratricopeptide repeat protein [Kribbella sp. NPDC005582]|uniref:tetratricopeptide repeat protein n=1 Tax=Kribbella sp. NPDC005582 TaxID=3156893 RepID=UPI0033A4AE1B
MNPELIDLLQRAESAPYGKVRSALLEDVVRRADAASEADLAFYSRLQLVTAYVMGGEPRKSLVPFARCVADWDAEPDKYREYSHLFHWCYKYAPSTLTKFPEVPLDRAYAVLNDMEQRWRLSGHSMHAVHQHRWLVAHHIGDEAAAAEQFRLWSTAPRDDLSDCVGCDPTSKVHHLTSVGRTADAVALAVNVLDGQLTCAEQPQQMLTALLPAYVAEGMYDEAVDAHRKAYRLLRNRVGELSEHADHVEFLARTGNELKAVELIERHAAELADPPSPYAEMVFSAAASLALSRVDQDLPIRQPQTDAVPAGALAERYAARALELAAQFDERNGTKHRSEHIQRVLTAEPWVEYLPLSETARRAQLRKQAQTEKAEQTAEQPTERPAVSGRGWLDRAEEDWRDFASEDAVAAWQAFEREVPESEWTVLDRARVLDGRGLAGSDDPQVALTAWSEALELYDQLGEEVRVLRTRGRIGRLLCEQGQVEEGLATGEEPMRWLIANDEPERRPAQRDSLAIMYAQVGRFAEAIQVLTEPGPGHQRPEHKGSTAILLANLLLQEGRLDEAEAAIAVAFDSPHDAQRSFAHHLRGRVRLELERPAEAAEDLIEAVALATGVPGLEPHLAYTRLMLARAYLLSGRPLEAAESAEESLSVLTDDALADARGVLIDAYRMLGENEAALAKVRELLADVSPDAHPAWLATLRQDEGILLEQLDRDDEAVDVFLDAAQHFGTAESPLQQAQAIRLAAQSARYTGDHARALELVTSAQPIIDALPSADQEVIFQSAGVHWDLALIHLQQGDQTNAVAHADEAADLYERGGYEDQYLNAQLLLAEHGTQDEKALTELFNELPANTDLWYRTGYLLVDRLRSVGQPDAAAALETRLNSES